MNDFFFNFQALIEVSQQFFPIFEFCFLIYLEKIPCSLALADISHFRILLFTQDCVRLIYFEFIN